MNKQLLVDVRPFDISRNKIDESIKENNGRFPWMDGVQLNYSHGVDEKALIDGDGECTIYGGGGVSDMAYDSSTELLHVGTTSGRSDFRGLARINNTTRSVSYISAGGGVIAEAQN